MKKVTFMMLAIAGALATQSCQNRTNNNAGINESKDSTLDSLNNSTALLNQTDTDDDSNMFMKNAAIGGMMEVEAGKTAISNASSAGVKNLAEMIVKDHEAANAELKALATGKSVVLPAELPADKQEHIKTLKGLKGKAFDDHYIKIMKEAHHQDIALFKEASNNIRSQDVREFAAKTLPVLEKHAAEVNKIGNK